MTSTLATFVVLCLFLSHTTVVDVIYILSCEITGFKQDRRKQLLISAPVLQGTPISMQHTADPLQPATISHLGGQ